MPVGIAGTVAFIAVTAFISYLSLVLGELVPKRLALQRGEGVALFVAPVLDLVATVDPAGRLAAVGVDERPRADARPGPAGRAARRSREEELRDMVSTHGELDAEERRVLTDVFGAADRQLSEVMVPRTEVEFLAAATAARRRRPARVLDKPHSRYPVTGETVDDVVGVVHVRDLLTAGARHRRRTAAARTVGDIARPVPLLPGSKPVLAALTEMRANRTHLAVVVDEYGGTDGIVTMEDIIEELVGEIEDEYDPAAPAGPTATRVRRPAAPRRAGRADRHRRCPTGPYETLAGFVQTQLGRVPAVGDVVRRTGTGSRSSRWTAGGWRGCASRPPMPTADDARGPRRPGGRTGAVTGRERAAWWVATAHGIPGDPGPEGAQGRGLPDGREGALDARQEERRRRRPRRRAEGAARGRRAQHRDEGAQGLPRRLHPGR